MDVRLPVTEKCPGSNPGVPAKSPEASDQSDWSCDQCGACCTLVDCPHFVQSHWADGGGVCGIYENRPVECRVPELMKTEAPLIIQMWCHSCRFLADQRERWHRGRDKA